jgi:YHS domain-containing protein
VIKGYDPVAYFIAGKPVRGSPGISFDWDDGRYHFSSPRNRDIFATDPERYAPRFSGYCTGSVAAGTPEEPDPRQWSIVDGKLYLFGSARSKERLESDPKGLASAESAWQQAK